MTKTYQLLQTAFGDDEVLSGSIILKRERPSKVRAILDNFQNSRNEVLIDQVCASWGMKEDWIPFKWLKRQESCMAHCQVLLTEAKVKICWMYFLFRMVWQERCFIAIAFQLCFRICCQKGSRKLGMEHIGCWYVLMMLIHERIYKYRN